MSLGLPWGLALTSGVNTYLPLFLLTLFARYTHLVNLSPHFQWLASDQAIIILGVLALGEVLAQKFPVVDNIWDFVHTLLRPIAGALAAGATSGADGGPTTALALLTGGTLATAAHSAKSSIHLVSTSKSFGFANPLLSLGEDLAVVAGTLLAVYAPWLMLGIVLLFVLLFASFGPWLLRTLRFDLRIVAAWLRWLGARILGAPRPQALKESLLELTPDHLRSLSATLDSSEDLLGVLSGWRRSGGPRRCWLLVTSRRLLLAEPRLFRPPKVRAIPYTNVAMVRERNLVLFRKLDLLTCQNETYTLSLPMTHAAFGTLAVTQIRELSRPSIPAGSGRPAANPHLAPATS